MISSDAYQTMNDTMREKFKLNNDSYGTLQGVGSQSAIYWQADRATGAQHNKNNIIWYFETMCDAGFGGANAGVADDSWNLWFICAGFAFSDIWEFHTSFAGLAFFRS